MKQTNCKRIACLVLSCLSIATAVSVTACGDTETGKGAANDTNAVTQKGTAETEAPEPSIYDDLYLPDLGGYEFRILNNISDFAYTKMETEGETGEALDDSIYIRNRKAEEALHIKLVVEEQAWDAVINTIKKQVTAGDKDYELFFDETGQLLGKGVFNTYLADMSDVSTIHYEKPWWNTEAMESIEIGDARYYLYSDMHLMLYESYAAIFYNKSIASSLDMPNFYDVVENGKWTLDLLKECITDGSADLNGDGKMDAADRYGFGYYDSCNIGFFVACGEPLIQKDKDGIPYWNGLTEKMVNVYEKTTDAIYRQNDCCVHRSQPWAANLDPNITHDMFHNGQMLFELDPIGSLKRFRDVDFEVGLLPLPKYDETQDRYYSYIAYLAAAGAVPLTVDDLERTGTILEVLAAYSNQYVRNAYFDNTLDFKYIQDEESQTILDGILSTGQFDLSALYPWGNLGSTVAEMMTKPSEKFVSTVEKREKSIQKGIAKTLEDLEM